MKRIAFWGVLVASRLYGQPADPSRVRLLISATSNPYLAGMPDGTRADIGDRAPAQSPILVPLSIAGATAVSFRAAGRVDHLPDCPRHCFGPDGDGANVTSHRVGDEHGIGGITAPMNALVGVFLGDDRPDRSRAPRPLDFGGKHANFVVFSPQLKQVFLIGRGCNKGVVRRFLVPSGATRLFLGVMDGFEWNNNTGSFQVDVAVERSDVNSNMYSVDSSVSFANWPCVADHARCTPGREIVEERGPGLYHVLLPAQLEWGASIATPNGVMVTVRGILGTVCLTEEPSSCRGPSGNGAAAGEGFLVPAAPAGALVSKTSGGRTYFSVNDRSGDCFQKHDGFFEFDLVVKPAQ